MAIINRASLPEEFYDTTSKRMLIAPEPQYVFAFLAKMSLGSALIASLPGGFAGINQARGIASQGPPTSGYQAGARLILASPDPMVSQAIATVAELGKSPGHTVRLNRPRYGSGGFTLASREITSGTQISTTPIDLTSEQVTLTLKRYGGPYDAVVQNAVAPFALDKFDTSVALHSLVDYVGLHMQRDLDKWLDGVMATFAGSGGTTLWPNGFSADNGSQNQGDMPMDVDMLFRGVETLKGVVYSSPLNIPVFPNGRYRAFISPTQARQLKADPQAAQFIRYDVPGMNPVTGLQGAYIGSIAGCDIFEATTLPFAQNANSVQVTTSVMLGPSMIGQGWGQLPQVAFSTDDNYGEHAKMVWLAYAAFGLLDNRFAIQLHTS
jgi:hypothetical protein